MMTRRTEEGALKCAFLDLRREDARAVGITVSRRVPTQTPGTTNSTRSGPWESQQQGNIIPALSLVILAIFEGGCYCRRWVWAAGCLIVVVRRRGLLVRVSTRQQGAVVCGAKSSLSRAQP